MQSRSWKLQKLLAKGFHGRKPVCRNVAGWHDENFRLQWPRTMICSKALTQPKKMKFFFSHFQRTVVVVSTLLFGFSFPIQTVAAQTQAVVSATSTV